MVNRLPSVPLAWLKRHGWCARVLKRLVDDDFDRSTVKNLETHGAFGRLEIKRLKS
jgi:hypothetical protein